MTNNAPIPAIEASAGCASCTTTAESSTERSASAERLPSTVETCQAVGMTCGHCTGAVTAAVAALEGVVDVRIDLNLGDSSDVTVATERPVAADRVHAAIEEAGYVLVES